MKGVRYLMDLFVWIPARSKQTALVTYDKNHTEQTLPTLSAWEQKVPFEKIFIGNKHLNTFQKQYL